MYVCVCSGVTDRDIERAVADGCRDLHDLAARTGVGAACGCCRDTAGELLASGGVGLDLPAFAAA